MHLADDAVFDMLARSFVTVSRAFGLRRLVAGEVPGLRYAALGGSIAGFNRLMVTAMDPRTATEDLEGALLALDHFPVLSAWVPPQASPPDLVRRLEAHGFVLDHELVPAMAADISILPELEPAPGVTWRFAAPGNDAELVTDVMVAGFEMPPDLRPFIGEVMVGALAEPDTALRIVLAERDGVPLSTALGGVVDNVVVIYNVATVPEARGRGLGRLVTLAALHDARARGAGAAVLESSEMGYGLYGGLGFQDVGRYRLLVRVRSAAT